MSDIKKVAERKQYFSNAVAAYNFDSDLGDTSDAIFLLRGLAQGVDDYQRIGDEILLDSVRIKGTVSLPVTSGTTAVSYVTMLVLNCKSSPQANGATMPWTSLLDANGSYFQWTGVPLNRMYPINDNDFELIYREDWPLTLFYSTTATSSVCSPTVDAYHSFDKVLKFNRKVKYDEGTTVPSNFNPFVCFAITDGNASTTGVYATTANLTMLATMDFRDP